MALKNKHLVFARTCTNTHGHFQKGDVARGAFSDALVKTYIDLGILVEQATVAEAPFAPEKAAALASAAAPNPAPSATPAKSATHPPSGKKD